MRTQGRDVRQLVIRRRSAAGVAAVLAVIGSLSAAGPATAGSFQVRSCLAARGGDYNAVAFAGGRSSRRMLIKRSCSAFGRGERGLITGNKVARRRLRKNEYAGVIFWAPPGTRIVRFDWSGKLRRGDCGFTVELYAVRPRARPRYIKRAAAGRDCPGRKAHSSYAPPRAHRLGSATALVQRVICRSRHGCSASRLTMLATRYAKAYITDFTRPGVRILGGGLASGRWVRGEQAVRYTAGDNVGIRSARLLLFGVRQVSRAGRPCNYARRGPCPNGPGTLSVLTPGALADGVHWLLLEVQDAAGNVSGARTRALVDNTAPARVAVWPEWGEGWRRNNVFAVRWTNPPERHAPIVAAFTRMCSSSTTVCHERRHAGASISRIARLAVPAPGEWTLSVWRQDAAGNASRGHASVPVRLRYDPDPPQLAFEHPAATDPTRVSVLVNERISGLAGGEIEIHRVGTTSWRTLATRRSGTRLVARINDSQLPAGTYQLRSRARDLAGNEASTYSRLDGAPMVLRLPLRFQAVMTAGIVRARTVPRYVRRRGRRRLVRRRVRRLVPDARVRLGRRARVAGRLTNTDGQPISGATVYVFSRSGLATESLAGVAATDRKGRFSYRLRATRSRLLRFIYLGTPLALPAQRQVSVRVPATSSLRVSRRRARNGQAVTFQGRVRSLPIPSGGKLLEMQAFFRSKWRTFSTVRTDRRGRWRFRYRFGGTVGRVRYRFRAWLPEEAGYPFERGRSRRVSVTVRGS